MLSFINRVQTGLLNPASLITAETTKQAFSLELSKFSDIEQVHTSGVNTIDIEQIEGRYLLSGGGNGKIFIHDLQNLEGKPQYSCKTIGKVSKKYSHQYSVERVQWYPADTGLFTSSGMDCKLVLWDTNTLKPIDTIKQNGKVFCHQISPTKTSLIAVSMASPHVSLVDLKSGSKSHNLMGHKEKVLSVCWSPTAETLLATGGSDNKLLLWDIRSSKGYLCALDRHNTDSDTTIIQKSTATAHGGAVNALKFTPDGLHLVSFGTDGRVRLWDVAMQRNTLVNYGKIDNDNPKCMTLDLCTRSDPGVLFVPSAGQIFEFDLFEGSRLDTMLGHFNSVNCCTLRPFTQELYSGGNDRNILIWLPYEEQVSAYEDYLKGSEERKPDLIKRNVTQDAWSSSDDDS